MNEATVPQGLAIKGMRMWGRTPVQGKYVDKMGQQNEAQHATSLVERHPGSQHIQTTQAFGIHWSATTPAQAHVMASDVLLVGKDCVHSVCTTRRCVFDSMKVMEPGVFKLSESMLESTSPRSCFMHASLCVVTPVPQ